MAIPPAFGRRRSGESAVATRPLLHDAARSYLARLALHREWDRHPGVWLGHRSRRLWGRRQRPQAVALCLPQREHGRHPCALRCNRPKRRTVALRASVGSTFGEEMSSQPRSFRRLRLAGGGPVGLVHSPAGMTVGTPGPGRIRPSPMAPGLGDDIRPPGALRRAPPPIALGAPGHRR